MLRRVNTYFNQRRLIPLAVGLSLLTAPPLVSASTGGGGVSPGAGSAPTASGNRSVSASANGVTITTRASGFLNRDMRFTGSVSSSNAGSVVEIERSGVHTGGRWVATTHATVQSDGSFAAYWHANRPGRLAFRAIMNTAPGGSTASSWPTVNVIVYRMAVATFYGPGFWGSQTACGEVLHRNTLGVAHRTLPCGTRVSIYYNGRTIQVPVIDRGPYANGADWDLTEATARALGMTTTSQVGGATVGRPATAS